MTTPQPFANGNHMSMTLHRTHMLHEASFGSGSAWQDCWLLPYSSE